MLDIMQELVQETTFVVTHSLVRLPMGFSERVWNTANYSSMGRRLRRRVLESFRRVCGVCAHASVCLYGTRQRDSGRTQA